MSQQSNIFKEQHVCPAERAGMLDSWIRRFIHPPMRIIGEYVTAGNTVIDIGCGTGYFTIPLAKLSGASGTVIAVDLQQEMLDRLAAKIAQTELAGRIRMHRCENNRVALDAQADFVLAFYMVHETPDTLHFLTEMRSMLKPGGRLLIVEPPIHVSKKRFNRMVALTEEAGLTILDYPKKKGGRSVLLGPA